ASGEDKTYFLIKCPATGLSVDTCSAKTQINTVLEGNSGSVDLVSGKGVPVARELACNNDNLRCLSGTATSTIPNTARGVRGILEITVDTFSTSKCGAFELNASVLP